MLSVRSRRRSWSTAGDDSPVDLRVPAPRRRSGSTSRRVGHPRPTMPLARPVGTPRPCARRTGRSCTRSATASTRPDRSRPRHHRSGRRTRAVSTTRTRSRVGYALTLAARRSDVVSVLDWGGGVGLHALLGHALLPAGVELEYHCRDLPLVCELGRAQLPGVQFHDDDACLDRTYDLVFASSSLQYSEQWTGVVDGLAAATGRYLFLGGCPSSSSARRSSCASVPSSTGSTPSS